MHRHSVFQKASVGKRSHASSGLIYHRYTGSTGGDAVSLQVPSGVDTIYFTLLAFSRTPAEPALEQSSYCRQPVSQSPSLPGYSPLPRRASSSLAVTGCSTSGYTLDAATRLQDFCALIDDLRATLLHHNSKEEFDTGNCADDDDDDNEGERLLRLLEDAMRKIQQPTEYDTPRLGGLCRLSLWLPLLLRATLLLITVPPWRQCQVFPSYYLICTGNTMTSSPFGNSHFCTTLIIYVITSQRPHYWVELTPAHIERPRK
ncbi:hypothetical protein BGY98DRAFT_1097176 [Russula aff. rugulosa BPL654]|nr:hypothetical protein BGY98DRAFT_1097176 [Russula aff. rugulosa BPL654]